MFSTYINIFFYDGPVSKAIAFDDVLTSSQNLLGKIIAASDHSSAENNLVSVATDGETFGHHKKFAERTLAYFINSLVPAENINIYNITVTNDGFFVIVTFSLKNITVL